MSDITLFQFSRAWGIPNPSPFCMKLEGYLRLGGLKYQVKSLNDPRKAPKGKLPFVTIGKQTIGDSELIYDYLKSNQLIDLDANLSPQQRAEHHALRIMCDEGLYFSSVYSRWVDDANWNALSEAFFNTIPKLIRGPITKQIRKKMRADIEAQGLGRHTPAEIYSIGSRHIECLSQYLGESQWFGGNEPVKLDVAVVSHLANLLIPPIESPLKETLEKQANLVAFVKRALEEIYE